MYRCPCGNLFALNLGAHGCPACVGQSGRAEISDGSDGLFFFRVVRMTRAQLEDLYRTERQEGHDITIKPASLVGPIEGSESHGRQE